MLVKWPAMSQGETRQIGRDMKDIVENLRRLGRARLIALGAVGVGLIAAVLVGLNVALAPTFAPLHADLSPASAGRMLETLEQAGFRVSVSGDGGTLSVPREDVARARMTLASAGLLSEGMPGWELFDEAGGLGVSTFAQRVNRLRALEGELARSIRTMSGIEAARVHLVLSEREAFSRERPEPSASVIARMRPGESLTRRQASSIRALVASAVPDLAPGRIAILSATGETILGPDEDEASIALLSRKAALEERLSARILNILGARVGADNARVQVNVDLSTTRQVTQSETYDPEGSVVRSTETREETTRERAAAEEEVGVAGNLPAAFADADSPAGPTSETDRADEVVNYEISATRTETISEPGAVEGISVAVLVDGTYAEGPEGDATYAPRPDEELARLAELVRAAIGFDEERGDSVSVDSMQFARPGGDALLIGGSAMPDLVRELGPPVLRGAFALGVVAAVLTLGVRPLVRTLAPPEPMAEIASHADGAAADRSGARAAGGAASGASGSRGEVFLPGELPEVVNVSGVNGGVSRVGIERARALAESNRDEALRTVRGWVAAG